MDLQKIRIGNREIGGDSPAYIIAEAGVNHNGDISLALELVRKAKETGADCVKFQTFTAESIVTNEAPKAAYQLLVTDPKESQLDMLKKLELDRNAYAKILKLCGELEIDFLSTPYNFSDARFLFELGVNAFKVASGQLVELPFLRFLANYKKPLIVSTGMGTLAEVDEAVRCLRDANFSDMIFLQCTTNYPAATEEANIRAMVSLRDALHVQIGYSDHTQNNYSAYAAIALGAKVIEKHFTIDKKLPGPDQATSLEPEEFAELVGGIRAIEAALGSPVKKPSAAEIRNTPGMRRSLVNLSAIKKGEVIRKEQLGFKRPGTALSPNFLEKVVGKKAYKDIPANTLLTLDAVEW
jgi:N,N'-diacetyllegionaminate synthase